MTTFNASDQMAEYERLDAPETPDDMEAVVERIQQDMDDVADLWRHCRIAFVEAADPDAVAGFPSFTKADLRALLLAYEERGRALEFVRGEARRGQTVRPGDACLVLIEARARASLKGKSHD